jgi:ABC-type nickel/cobalt efflux system permease component RcnA/ABC-type uncharacterized transport system substrate-binding protein
MIQITWEFAHEFSAELSRDYDKNANNRFEKNEVAAIEQSIIDYIKPLEFLTTIKYNPKDSKKNIDEIEKIVSIPKSYQTYFVDGLLRFSYQIETDIDLNDKGVLFLTVHDEGGYFIFSFKNENVTLSVEDIDYTINARANALFIDFSASSQKSQPQDTTKQTPSSDQEVSKKQNGFTAALNNISQRLQGYLSQIKTTNDISAFLAILAFSFIYGALHAAGPGHGKTVVASYIFSTDKSIAKALFVALAIGTVHAFSAFILTIIIYFLVTGFLLPFVENVEQIVTKLSATIIITIALTLLYKKITRSLKAKKQPKFSIHKPSCGCASCKIDSKTTDLGVILSAGLIPCPGTVIIFIVTISQGMFFIGVSSAVFMSLGMSFIIFLTALFSIGIKKGLGNQKIITVFEYLSLVLILTVGGLMLML